MMCLLSLLTVTIPARLHLYSFHVLMLMCHFIATLLVVYGPHNDQS